jgi:hypothetical protein
MHLKVLACEVAAREIYLCAAQSVNSVSVDLLTQGLHDNSDEMRRRLQQEINAVDETQYDAVLLGYGLCNNGIVGLRARGRKLVVPRAHDCITFFLGSKERYAKEFEERPGTFYYTSGWIEYPERRGERLEQMGKSGLGDSWRQMKEYQKLVEKYGESNAKYLVEMMGQWEEKYSRGAFIEFEFNKHLGFDERAREICRQKGWEFALLEGRLELLQNWLDGKWDDEHFLMVEPGFEVAADYRGGIVKAVPSTGTEGGQP